MTALCFVLGCGNRTVISARHRSFGLVGACEDHNPIRHAYDAPLVSPDAPALLAEYAEIMTRQAPTPETGSGGSKVPRVPVPPAPSTPPAVAVPDVAF